MPTTLLTLLAPLALPLQPPAAGTSEPPLLTVHSVAVSGDQVWLAGEAQGTKALRLFPGNSDVDFAVMRTDLDGRVDGAFGVNGLARVDFGGDVTGVVPAGNDAALGLALVDGGAVLAGYAGAMKSPRLAIAKLDGTGAPFVGFGAGGRAERDWGKTSMSSTVRATPGGSLLVAGKYSKGSANGMDVAVVRFTAAGTVDPTFGVGDDAPGAVIHRGRSDDSLDAEWIGGRLWVLVGEKFRVTRLTATGEVDPSFGTNGWFELEDDCSGWALEPTPGGGALVAGVVKRASDRQRPIFRFVKLSAAGTLDPTFGRVDWDPTAGSGSDSTMQAGFPRGLVVDDAGGFLLYAELRGGLSVLPCLFRFGPTGALQTAWGVAGRVVVEEGFLDPLAAAGQVPTPHHLVRRGDEAIVGDTLFRSDPTGNSQGFVWVARYGL